MALLTCALTLAALAGCEPDRATASRVLGTDRISAVVYPESVSVVNLCGPRMSIRNANDDSVAVQYAPSGDAPRTTVRLPKRPAGTPYSETYVIMTGSSGVLFVWIGARRTDKRFPGSTCATFAPVTALPPAPPSQQLINDGIAFYQADSLYDGVRTSTRRMRVIFQLGTSREVRQAVLDEAGLRVLGGLRGPAEGAYYVEIVTPSGVGHAQLNAIRLQLQRNAAIRNVWVDGESGVAVNGLTPNDGANWNHWLLDSVDITHYGWHLESGRFPLAWGCTIGRGAVGLAVVDALYESNPDVPAVVVGAPSTDTTKHASNVASILRANGNNGVANNGSGMTGGVWLGGLSLFSKNDAASAVAGFLPPFVPVGEAGYGMARAIASGARVVNASLGLFWKHQPSITSLVDTNRVADQADAFLDGIARAFQRLDSLGQPRPLIVLAAGNNSIDASWSLPAAVTRVNGAGSIRNEVIVVGGLARTATPQRWNDGFLVGTNTGDLVDIVAPAKQVHALSRNDGDTIVTGTSFAAPQVAAAAALLFASDSTLGAADVKSLLIAGARADGRSVPNVGSISQPTIPVLNAYESLRLLSQRPGRPLCGNRVWSDSSGLFIARGTTVEYAAMPGSGLLPHDLMPYHGGRMIGASAWSTPGIWQIASLPNQGWQYAPSGWVASTAMSPSGAFENSVAGSWNSSMRIGDFFFDGQDGPGARPDAQRRHDIPGAPELRHAVQRDAPILA